VLLYVCFLCVFVSTSASERSDLAIRLRFVSGNELTAIDTSAFADLGKLLALLDPSNLSFLLFDSNPSCAYSPVWFVSRFNVARDLSNNQLSVLPDGVFVGMPSLQVL
jgi:hypothetical protein